MRSMAATSSPRAGDAVVASRSKAAAAIRLDRLEVLLAACVLIWSASVSRRTWVPTVLVTMRFTEQQLGKIRAVSPELEVTCEDAGQADYSPTDIHYPGSPPGNPARAPTLKWVQL